MVKLKVITLHIMPSQELDELSILLNKKLTINEKKRDGIYFTPSKYALELYQKCNRYNKKLNDILECSCGSGEFLKILPKTNVTAIEYNKTIYNNIKDTYKNVINQNYLHYHVKNKHDLIISNPPYYMTKQKYDSELLFGRNNMHVLFLVHSMNIIKDNGIIAFIIPTNFMNSSYYNKIRKELYTNYRILEFVQYDTDMFKDTKQKVFGLIIQKKKPKNNDKFVFIKNEQYYFVFDKNSLPTENYKTLSDLNCNVGVGSITFKNANIHLFSSTGNTKMIYSNDITHDSLSDSKKNYRYLKDDANSLQEPILVTNRGYGNSNYVMKVKLLEGDYKYQLENHVLYIKHPDNNIEILKQIQKSLLNENTKKFIDIMFGNNAINCFELKNIIPIYL